MSNHRLDLNFNGRQRISECLHLLKNLSPVEFTYGEFAGPDMRALLTLPEACSAVGRVTLTFENGDARMDFMRNAQCQATFQEFAKFTDTKKSKKRNSPEASVHPC
jgi:hypothetical protein